MRRLSFAGVSLAVAVGALACRGCSDGDLDSRPLDASEPSPDHAPPVDARSVDAPTCKLPPRPAHVPDGWRLYEGYDPCCGFYIPTKSEQLPPALQWESCGPELYPGEVACQRVALDRNNPADYLSPQISSTVATDGALLFQVSRFTRPFVWRLIIEASGRVRHAFLETDSNRCTLGGGYLWRDHYVLSLNEYLSSELGGFVAGDLGSLTPTFAKRHTDLLSHSLYTGPFGIVDTAARPEILLYPWADLAAPKTLWVRDDGLNHAKFVFTENATFWTASSYQAVKVKIWTPDGRVRDLVAFPEDAARGAGAMGTDGRDMVWLEGPPRPPGDGGLDTYAIMAARYTTDSSQVQAQERRLRSEIGSAMGAERFEVGCGFAARSRHDGLRIVRIADGHSWFLPSKGRWNWQRVQHVGCDEVFVRVMDGPRAELVRVRLDSLGPGDLPD